MAAPIRYSIVPLHPLQLPVLAGPELSIIGKTINVQALWLRVFSLPIVRPGSSRGRNACFEQAAELRKMVKYWHTGHDSNDAT
jgi:hypothetical protein